MTTQNLLIEIGTEELPPKSLMKLAEAFKHNTENALKAADLSFSNIKCLASPRRLALVVEQLQAQQSDKLVEKKGPALSAAFDEQGQPSKAAQGWARANGIDVSEASRLVTDKGEWLLFKALVPGKNIKELVIDIIESALKQLPIPKPMRWGTSNTQFIRPIHTVTVLYGNELIEGKVLEINSARKVMGHRFHGAKFFELDSADNYEARLLEHKVTVDFAKRKAKILADLTATAASLSAVVDMDEALLDEVTALVEWPVTLSASFELSFLEVPKEALIYTMKGDQKYFPLLSQDGNLLAKFLFVSNIECADPSNIIHGNEKVIRPRLADAEFFFTTDKKNSLESRLDSLKDVLFQKQLGTLFDKSQRISLLAADIAQMIGCEPELAKRAGLLCKTDLMTNMVMEFPDVQGVMGMHYARHDGEIESVALALHEQYMPRFAGDQLPSSQLSYTLAIADKVDTLVGIFGIGQVPKGDKDPFALRRAAIGLIRIIVEGKLDLDLVSLVKTSIGYFADKVSAKDLETQVVDFILARFKAYYSDLGVEQDVIQAVALKRPTRPLDYAARIVAVSEFKQHSAASALAAANKRVANILTKNAITETATLSEALLVEPAEQELAKQLDALEARVRPLLEQSDYANALLQLATLQAPIDAFFDTVMVMAEQNELRTNRLALLSKVRNLFLYTADISVLS